MSLSGGSASGGGSSNHNDSGGSSAAGSNKIDVYSFGVLIWVLWTGEMPYVKAMRHLTPFSLMVKLVEGLRPTIPTDVPEEVAGLMRKCWHEEPTSRPSFEEIGRVLQKVRTQLKKEPERERR